MTRVHLKMIPAFERVLDREPGVKRTLRAAAEEAASIARATAPVASGTYRDSIEVDDDGNLSSSDFKAHWIEWGSANNRAYATLRNAAAEVASRIRED